VTAELINLRRARKAKARSAAAVEAAENRRRFGLSKSARALNTAEKALADRNFEAHRRDRVQCPDDVDER
jgi:Domain of unknown function (DUF4169)